MKITIRYENRIAAIDVPEEDFTLMIRLDYEERLKAVDPVSVSPRTPQEILDERFNKPDYNNWQKHNRRWDAGAIPEEIPDRAAAEKQAQR